MSQDHSINSQHPPSRSPTIITPHTLHSNIPYTQTKPHSRQVLDIYIPTTQNAANSSSSSSSPASHPLPLILYVHGGAFKYGDKSSPFLPHRQLAHNYAIAAINYRRSGEALFPAMIQDCKSALRFLKSPETSSQFNLDPRRIVIWGESAGGHAAAFCGTTSYSTASSEASQKQTGYEWDVGDYLSQDSVVQGVVDYYGPTDFLSMDAHLPAEWATHNGAESPESLYLGGQITRDDMREKVRAADPVTYIKDLVAEGKEETLPRFFVAHGTEDRIVPEFMSTLLVSALEEANVEVEYLPVHGADHGFRGITEQQQQLLDEKTDAFLKRAFGV